MENQDQETTAATKGRIFTKLAKEIMVAARAGADPDMNSKLRLAIDQAKKASMPKDTIERAIKKGAGLLDDGVTFEKVTYEGFAPHRVPVIVECLTDNVNRTVTNIRILFREAQLGNSGSVAWDFDYLGMIEATPAAAAGCRDRRHRGRRQRSGAHGKRHHAVFTAPSDLDAVSRALPAHGFAVQSAQLGYRPKNPVTLDDTARGGRGVPESY